MKDCVGGNSVIPTSLTSPRPLLNAPSELCLKDNLKIIIVHSVHSKSPGRQKITSRYSHFVKRQSYLCIFMLSEDFFFSFNDFLSV